MTAQEQRGESYPPSLILTSKQEPLLLGNELSIFSSESRLSMCDEDHIASQLRRKSEEDIAVNLKHDIESFFAQKYVGTSCHFQELLPQGSEMAKVDFTVSRGHDFRRRYVGSAGYIDGHLSLGNVIRLM